MPRPSPALLTLLFAAPLGCKGASEPPNDGADEDSAPCDGWVRMIFPDADGDGFGVEEGAIEGCYPPPKGYAIAFGDCDDTLAEVHPDAHESCLTEWDDNCDGYANVILPNSEDERLDHCTPYYQDVDADGLGVYDSSQCLCQAKGQYTALEPGDCDDDDPAVGSNMNGCYTLDNTLWTARWDGFQEGQGLMFNNEGAEVAVADLTGDGVPDLLVGSHNTQAAKDDYSGALYLVSGPLMGLGRVALNDPQVFRLNGEPVPGEMLLGVTVAVVDLNGDGANELVTSAYNQGVWVLDSARWQQDGLDARIAWMETPADPYSELGSNVAVTADLDGNGLPELLLGDPYDDRAYSGAGAATIVENPPAGRYDVNTVYKAVLTGESSSDHAGACVANAGDTDGDGLSDVLVGAPYADSMGAVYLLHGPLVGDVSLADADAIYTGGDPSTATACPLAGGGDANGDGLDDLLVGAPTVYQDQGAAYLVLGRADPRGGRGIAVAAYARFQGPEREERWAVFHAGTDVEFLQTDAGDHAVVVGSGDADILERSGGAVTVVVDPAPGIHIIGEVGVTVHGEDQHAQVGWSLAPAPDLDADGWGELIVGAPSMSPGGVSGAGSVFLLPGGVLGGLQ